MIGLFRRTALGLIAVCLLAAGTVRAVNTLQFHPASDRLDVSATDWTLDELLAQIGGATDWEIYVEPNSHRTITARFRDLPVGEALGRLLGDLNYALLPRDHAPAKLLVFRTSPTDATRRVIPVKRPADKRVPNELLLTLKPGADIDALARSLGGKVKGRIDGHNVYRLEFADEDAVQAARNVLASNNLVGDVSDNYYFDRPLSPDSLTASSALPFSLKPTVSTDGSRLVIGLVDTPVQPMGGNYDAFLLPSLTIDNEFKDKITSLTPTHGTSMAETLLKGLAIASENSGNGSPVRVLPVDVYGGNETTTTFNVAWGISKAIDGGATIINLSLGSPGDSRILQTIIQNASSQGVVFFAAAGNTPTTAPTFPAAYPQVIAVTAADSRGNVAPYANYGSFVDVYGPGANIVVMDGRYYIVTGTSTATAYMSGTAAGLASKWGQSPTQVELRLRQVFGFKPPSN